MKYPCVMCHKDDAEMALCGHYVCSVECGAAHERSHTLLNKREPTLQDYLDNTWDDF